MRIPYKVYPANNDPGFDGATNTWMPIVSAALMVNHTKTARFEVLVDSGAFTTYFHSDIGEACGLTISAGVAGQLCGVVEGP